MTRKGEVFEWGAEQEQALRKLKEELLKNSTLSHCSATDPIMLKTDACKEGIAGMSLQQEDGDWVVL